METETTTKHPLHVEVAEVVREKIRSGDLLLLDSACVEDNADEKLQHLPLFRCDDVLDKSRATQYSNVDMLVVRNGRVRMIVEIEESSTSPVTICGKVLASGMANCLIHLTLDPSLVEYADHVTFVQVAKPKATTEDGSKKEEQFRLLESSIRAVLPSTGIGRYRLFYVEGANDTCRLEKVAAYVARRLDGDD